MALRDRRRRRGHDRERLGRAFLQPRHQLGRIQIRVDRQHETSDAGHDRRRKAGADVVIELIGVSIDAG